MRTKTLLIATAAALAAGIISSQAQVYSQNIVGYVNKTLTPGFVNIDNPLDNSAGNSLTNIVPDTGNSLDGTLVYTWNGSGYTIYTIDSGQPTGLGDFQDNNPLPSPTINPGTLFYFDNNTASTFTNTFVGTVHVDAAPTGSQVVGTSTNNLIVGYNFVSSKIPVAGGIAAIGLTNNVVGGSGRLDGTLLYIPNIISGSFHGYTIVTIDSGQSTGYGDFQDNNAVPEPVIPVNQGFIFYNNTASPITWTQSF
jgi:hypothetical protein